MEDLLTETNELYLALGIMVAAAVSLVYLGSKRGLESVKAAMKAKNSVIPEMLSMADAAQFPINGSIALFTMYVLVKYLPSSYLGLLIGFYLTVMAVFALNYFVRPILGANILVGLASIATGFLYFYTDKHWMLTNLFGISISVMAIQSMLVGSFSTGAILLSGLFFYDIFWVFGTDVMVSVATNIDGPIKILCPQNIITWRTDRMNLLGLGDIVIPGFYIAMLCVYSGIGRDFMRGKNNNNKSKKGGATNIYFVVAIIAYTLSLINTMVVMVVFKHAQPALLYIVPWLLITTLLTALVKGELGMLFSFDISMLYEPQESSEEKAQRLKKEKEAEEAEKKRLAAAGEDQDTITWIVKDFFGLNPPEEKDTDDSAAEEGKKKKKAGGGDSNVRETKKQK